MEMRIGGKTRNNFRTRKALEIEPGDPALVISQQSAALYSTKRKCKALCCFQNLQRCFIKTGLKELRILL